jgi:hypothetical protein
MPAPANTSCKRLLDELHCHLQFSGLPGDEKDRSLVPVALSDITARSGTLSKGKGRRLDGPVCWNRMAG